MRQAIRASKKGYPAPNPHVGCVIVSGGQLVGTGFHNHAGGPHAERVALAEAGSKAKGADVFVSLEPCNHTGRTTPCSDALIEAGVARVLIAVRDPNPKAAGGIEKLRSAGINVIESILSTEAEQANVKFLFAMRNRRPFVIAKTAMSLDGRIALPSGESQWITGVKARNAGHELRAEAGAVLVGRRTVELDNPTLTVRHKKIANQPMRIVLDPDSKLEPGLNIFNSDAPTIRYTRNPQMPYDRGLATEDPNWILEDLFSLGVTSLLIEGGSQTLGRFVAADLIDRYEIFVGPKLLGEGPVWINAHLGGHLSHIPKIKITSAKILDLDLQISGVPARLS